MTKSDLTIIILNYNTADWVSRCLESIQKYHQYEDSSIRTEVVVVDNASQDNSVEVIKKKFPGVKVIVSEKNLGFAAGNNLALHQAKTAYVMLLNSDTEFVEQTQLESIIWYMDEHPEVAVTTPKLELSTGGLDLAAHRGEPTPWASFTYFSGVGKVLKKSPLFAQYHQTYKNFNAVHEIDACSGAAMIVRTSAMEKVGYLDEQFFMYAEDLDWCKRFREAGYKIIYFPISKIIHHKYKSGRGNQNAKLAKKTNALFYDTMLQYYDKHYRSKYPFIVRVLVKLFITLKKGVL
jgi:GT2 family glycosyltransferase